ncbi:hypothetical protein BH11PLA2_BH11PLA2_26950 [soil metagenome]
MGGHLHCATRLHRGGSIEDFGSLVVTQVQRPLRYRLTRSELEIDNVIVTVGKPDGIGPGVRGVLRNNLKSSAAEDVNAIISLTG